jgi:hypothetical protein
VKVGFLGLLFEFLEDFELTFVVEKIGRRTVDTKRDSEDHRPPKQVQKVLERNEEGLRDAAA